MFYFIYIKKNDYYRCTHHGECFSGSSLSISENAGIVTLEGTFNDFQTKIVIDLKIYKIERFFFFSNQSILGRRHHKITKKNIG